MKVIQINTFSYKAAGNIMMNLHRALLNKGVDSYVVWEEVEKHKMNMNIIWMMI